MKRYEDRGSERLEIAAFLNIKIKRASPATILFGTSMLVSNLIPGLVLGVIFAASGCVILYLVHLMVVLDKMERSFVDRPQPPQSAIAES